MQNKNASNSVPKIFISNKDKKKVSNKQSILNKLNKFDRDGKIVYWSGGDLVSGFR